MKSIFKTSLLVLALILLVPCNSKAQSDNKEFDDSTVVNAYRQDVELNIQLKDKIKDMIQQELTYLKNLK